MAEQKSKTPATRTVAQFTGFHGAQRILTRADQNAIAGVTSGVGTADLVWGVNNGKLDVTDVHPDVLEYLKSDPEFKITEVAVSEESTPA